MDNDIRKYVTIIALDTLIRDINITLSESSLETEDRETLMTLIDMAVIMLGELGDEPIVKPEWDKL